MHRVLVADPDTDTVDLIAELLKDEGFVPIRYPGWLLSAECIAQAQADMLVLGLGPGDASAALDLVGDLRRDSHITGLPVIILSTDNLLLARMAQPFHDLGCVALAKPFDLDEFLSSIRKSLGTSHGPMQFLTC
jgi:DNA-binding response OmpR family regulator